MAIDNILDMFSKSIHILLTSLAFLLFFSVVTKITYFYIFVGHHCLDYFDTECDG